MQLRHIRTVREASAASKGVFPRVSCIAWSPNSLRLAVATADRQVLLYDENGDAKDSFTARPGKKVTAVKGAFLQ